MQDIDRQMQDRAAFALSGRDYTTVTETTSGTVHTVVDGALAGHFAAIGATHTLWLGYGPGKGARAAKLQKNVLCVATDENPDGSPLWEKWTISKPCRWDDFKVWRAIS